MTFANLSPTLYDRQRIGDLPWPDSPAADYVRRFTAPLVTSGPRAFIDNVDAPMMVMLIGSTVLPVVVSPERPMAADVCSPYSHYRGYTYDEIRKLRGRFTRAALRATLSALSTVYRTGQLDRVVYVNNWLLATNPAGDLTAEDIHAATQTLLEQFPDHAIVFRTVNPTLDPVFARTLHLAGYGHVASRQVYLVDTTTRAFRRNENLRRDRRLLRTSGYEVIDGTALGEADAPRLAALYRGLYLHKHSPLNPQFNDAFFALIIRERLFHIRALRKAGRIDAFVAYFRKGAVTIGGIVGYDLTRPIEDGLYRQICVVLLDDAAARGDWLNFSAGAGSFKLSRAARAYAEYDAVYRRHLSYGRRLTWLIAAAGGRWHRTAAARKRSPIAHLSAPTTRNA